MSQIAVLRQKIIDAPDSFSIAGLIDAGDNFNPVTGGKIQNFPNASY